VSVKRFVVVAAHAVFVASLVLQSGSHDHVIEY
jgi:hypothetical protein